MEALLLFTENILFEDSWHRKPRIHVNKRECKSFFLLICRQINQSVDVKSQFSFDLDLLLIFKLYVWHSEMDQVGHNIESSLFSRIRALHLV